jgi:hypothetical protein
MKRFDSEWVRLELELPAEMWDGQPHTLQWVDDKLYFDDRLVAQGVSSPLSACTSSTKARATR